MIFLRRPLITIFFVAFTVRFLVILASTSAAFEGWTIDDQTYSWLAETRAAGTHESLWGAYEHVLFHKTLAFMGPLTLIYSLLGPVEFAGQLFVALMGSLTAVFVGYLALRFLPPVLALLGGHLIAVLPSQVFWSSVLLKDAVVWFLLGGLSLCVWHFFKTGGRTFFVPIIGLAAIMFALGHAREHTLVVAVIALLGSCLLLLRQYGLHRLIAATFICAVVPWAVGIGAFGHVLVLNAGSLEERRIANAIGAQSAFVQVPAPVEDPSLIEARVNEHEQALARIEQKRQMFVQGLSEAGPKRAKRLEQRLEAAQEKERRFRELLEREQELLALAQERIQRQTAESEGTLAPDIAHLPTGLFALLVEPAPWGWNNRDSSSLRLARLESFLWYPLLALAIVGLPLIYRHREVLLFPCLLGAGILLLYALTEGSIGTAYRHRGEFVWVVVLLAASGLQRIFPQLQTSTERADGARKLSKPTDDTPPSATRI